jgi:hypothetical protein
MGDGALVDYQLIPASVRNAQEAPVTGPNAYLVRTKGPPSLALRPLDQINQTTNDPNSPEAGSAGGVIPVLRPMRSSIPTRSSRYLLFCRLRKPGSRRSSQDRRPDWDRGALALGMTADVPEDTV